MDYFMESLQDMKLNVYEACLENKISIYERDLLLSELDNKYMLYSESLKEVGKSIKTVVTNPKSEESKKILTDAADKYNQGMNKRATAVASKIVKDPTKGGTIKVSPEVYDKYKKDMLKWRTTYKVGEILATGAIAIGPIDTVIKIATATAMSRSNDPVDKATMELMNKLKDKALAVKNKVADLVNKVRGKKMSEQELSSQLSAVDTATAAVAKQTDAVKARKANATPAKAVSESVYEKMDSIFMENTTVKDNAYEILNMLIEQVDFNEVDMLPVVFHYTGI